VTDVARVLRWDSDFFGFEIGRLEKSSFDESAARALTTWMTQQRVKCTYCLFDANDATSVRTAEAHGGRFADMRLTYSMTLGPRTQRTADVSVRKGRPSDLPALEPIARASHTDSRFYFDDRFERRRVDDLYAVWIEKSLGGALADGVTTFDHDGRAAGYVTYKRDATTGEIGLVAVGEQARGRGAASALVDAALATLEKEGVTRVNVVTQARNTAAQRLYQRAGFTLSTAQIWYHLWSPT
jgi:dTDP-4-amino-4,6-dideoxy-D-galactose acyltransferase